MNQCQICNKELNKYRRIFCSDKCQRVVEGALRSEERLLQKMQQLLKDRTQYEADRAVTLEQERLNNIEEVQQYASRITKKF